MGRNGVLLLLTLVLAAIVNTTIVVATSAHNFKARLEAQVSPLNEENLAGAAKPKGAMRISEALKYINRKDITKLARSLPNVEHKVIFAIRQRNVDELERILNDVSDPFSSNYGKFMTTAEVDELTNNPGSAEAVVAFLHRARSTHKSTLAIEKRSRSDQFITVTAPIRLWEDLLHAEFHEFATTADPTLRFHRALYYAIPAELEQHVAAVFNTAQMPDVHRMVQRKQLMLQTSLPEGDRAFHTVTSTDSIRQGPRATIPPGLWGTLEPVVETDSATENSNPKGAVSGSKGIKQEDTSPGTLARDTEENQKEPTATSEMFKYVTPALLNRYYNIHSNDGGNRGSQAVYETIGQTVSPSDLTIFQKKFGLPVQAMAHIIGGHSKNDACQANHGNDCIEANLDVQYLMAVAQSVPTTYYYWAGDDFLLEWILQVADMTAPPLVFSISYGADEVQLPPSYGAQFDIQAMKLGVRGVTILASSGDDGAVSPSATSNSMACGYNPSFPATSPYVTAVGGTMGPEHHTDEVVCQSDKGGIITSGGGFSTIYARPAWQANVVDPYVASLGQGATGQGGVPGRGAPLPGFNRGGRGYPDVSALAFNYVVAVNANFTAVSGTSASAPVLAGFVALVNSERIAAGKAPLGWLNPALYQLYASFARDITQGANNCAANARVCCGHGYSAMPGWDPVTGLGSVDFTKFRDALMATSAAPTAAPTYAVNAPTPSPTAAPAPTRAPTAYPTISKGWMFLQEYSEQNCDGDIVSVSGVPVGVCLPEYDSNNRAVGSVLFSCDSVQAKVSSYSSSNCNPSKLQDLQVYGLGCAVRVTDSYYYPGEDEYYSTSLACEVRGSGTAALVPPVPVTVGVSRAYLMQSSYDSLAGCDAALLSEYELFLENHCFEVADPAYGDYSYKFTFPNVAVHEGLGCRSKRPQIQALPTTCTAANVEDDDPGYYSVVMADAGKTVADGRLNYAVQRLIAQLRSRIAAVKAAASTTDADVIATAQPAQSYGDAQTTNDLFEQWSLVHSKVALNAPSAHPTTKPTVSPTSTPAPSTVPTYVPSASPTLVPTFSPTPKDMPTVLPTALPTALPTDTAAPTEVPTVAPSQTPAPTRGPTQPQPVGPTRDQVVTITVTQALEGLTATDFREAGLNAESVFKHAVAKSVSSFQPGDIRIKSIADDYIVVSNAASVQDTQDTQLSFRARSPELSGAPLHTVLYRMLRSLPLPFMRSSSAATNERSADQPQSAYISVCVVTYGIKFSTKEGGYPNGDAAYAEVSAQLASAVADKSFDAYLHQYALIYTERVLQNAHTPDSSDALYSTYTVEERSQTDDNPSDTPQTQGLGTTGVLLVVLFTALTVLGCVFCWSWRGKLTGGRYAELGSESTHNLDPALAGQSQRDNSPRSSRPSLARLAASSILGRRILRTGHGSPHGSSEGDSGRGSTYGTVGPAGDHGGQQGRRGHRFTIEEEEEEDDAMETIHLHDEESGGPGQASPLPSAPPAHTQKQKQKLKQGSTESGVGAEDTAEIELATVSHNPLVAGQDEENASNGV